MTQSNGQVLVKTLNAGSDTDSTYSLKDDVRPKGSTNFYLAVFVLSLTLIPCIAYVQLFGVNVPFLDDWYFLQVYKDWQLHQIGWLDILAHQHNEHRLGVAFAIQLIVAKISHCNSIWQMNLFVVCRALTALLLLDLFRTERDDKRIPLIFAALLGMDLFSLRQFENLLWGFQPCIGLSCLFFVSMVWLLCKYVSSTPAFYGSAIAAMLATFSFASGLLAGPIGLLTILSQKTERGPKFRSQVWIWCIIWLSSVGLYFCNFHTGAQPVLSQGADHAALWLERGLFFIACIGNSVGISKRACLFAGFITALMVALTVNTVRKADGKTFSRAGAALCLYGLGSALMMAMGRCDEGWGRAVNSRYSSLTCFLLLGLTMLALRKSNSQKIVPWLLGILITFGWATSTATFGALGKPFKDVRGSIVPIVFNWELMNRSTRMQLFPCKPESIDTLVQFLRAEKLSLFHDDLQPVNAKSIEAPTLVHAVATNNAGVKSSDLHFSPTGIDSLIVSGWALRTDTNRTLKVQLLIDNKYRFNSQGGLPTTHLPEALKNDQTSKSGFAVVLQPSQFAVGKHQLSLRLYSDGYTEFTDYGPFATVTVD